MMQSDMQGGNSQDMAGQGDTGEPGDLPSMAIQMLTGLSDAIQKSGAPKEAIDMVVKGGQMVIQGLQMAQGGAQPAPVAGDMGGGNPNAAPTG